MACHIYPATHSPRAKRYRADISADERARIENGIWMCYTHGKLIDNDEVRFTAEMLFLWKAGAEFKAQYIHEYGKEIEGPIPPSVLRPAPADLRIGSRYADATLIGQTLVDSGVELLWGKRQSDALRDFLVEVVRNAISHGSADKVELRVTSEAVELRTNGDSFNQLTLDSLEKGRGGAKAVAKIKALETRATLAAISYREDEANIIKVTSARSLEEVQRLSPCVVDLHDHVSLGDLMYEIRNAASACNAITVVLPSFMSYSDIQSLSLLQHNDKFVTLVISNLSEGVIDDIKRLVPDAALIEIAR